MKWFNVRSGQLIPSKDMSIWSGGRVVQRRVWTITNLNKNDEATYECQLKRHIVHHTALAAVNITIEGIRMNLILFIYTFTSLRRELKIELIVYTFRLYLSYGEPLRNVQKQIPISVAVRHYD